MVNCIGIKSTHFFGKNHEKIQPLLPLEIKIESVTVVGVNQVPQIVYRTSKGKCSTFLSKAKLINCLLCFLQIKHPNFSKVMSYSFQISGINIDTENGNFFIANSEINAFLERYNRATLEKLEVKLTAVSSLVINRIKGTVAEVNNIGCSCADMVYRHTICKHQIATHLYLQLNGWDSFAEYLQQNTGKKWEEKFRI
ncbi:hypothetical protein [Okeania sp.]|uniref:hypothetical protein n=1 Tax=Okeania sp. TaxID=3100323 RepID=UPI002B4B6A82|nr:hypothetical protein [Okeania sp.]MEB3339817.1 hypothetical protein [Okeania sp.]